LHFYPLLRHLAITKQ